MDHEEGRGSDENVEEASSERASRKKRIMCAIRR